MKSVGCPENCQLKSTDLFGRNCTRCGLVPVFADDVTIIVSDKNPENNKTKLREKLNEVTKFLNNNGLVVNQEKCTKMSCYLYASGQ